MPYEQKTQEITLDSLEEILSDVEEALLAGLDEAYEVFDEAPGLASQELYEISQEMLEPLSEAMDTSAEIPVPGNSTTVAGMGVYQITARKKAKNAVSHAAVRHLRRAHRLLGRLHADGALLDDEETIFEDIDGFLKRNQLI